jgi:hypothetical protein
MLENKPLMRAAVGLVCLLHAVADSYAGNYRLEKGDRQNGTIDGKTLPSCGPTADTILSRYAVVRVVHDPKAGTVNVNGEAWRLVGLDGTLLAQIEIHEPADYLLTVHFLNRGDRARGRILLLRLDSDRKPVCRDAFGLSGSYKR